MANPNHRLPRDTNDFTEYVRSVISLDALEKLTDSMDQDIEESQKLMDEIKTMFNSIPNQASVPAGNGQEDLSNFLEADSPKPLIPGMAENYDLNNVITTLKRYAEDLKRNCSVVGPVVAAPCKDMGTLDLDQYATSLDQLGKRLANIRLNKQEINSRNPGLEEKLTQLCQDVNNFTQMVHTKTRMAECTKNWPETWHDSAALQYNDAVTKLLSGINEVTYLLQNGT